MLSIRKAKIEDLHQLVQLFDAYRQFYKQVSNIMLATQFIRARLTDKDSIILVAENEKQQLIGFCQIYPSFCSVAARSEEHTSELQSPC